MVQRPQQEHAVDALVGDSEPPRVTLLDLERSSVRRTLLRLAQVEQHGVDEPDAVAERREPLGVHAGAAAHIEDVR